MVVRKVITETHDTKTLLLEDEQEGGRPFDYNPGQYLTFRFDQLAERPVIRSYTMSSAPSDGNFSAVTVKEVEGGFVSSYLCRELKEGDLLRARGPIGRFCYQPRTDHGTLSMVAAGSGVTPFISIMKGYKDSLGREGSPAAMNLLVCFRSQNDLICKKTLAELARVAGIRVLISLTRENRPLPEGFLSGRISAAMLDEAFGDYQNQTFMACGPASMMDLVRAQVLSHGVEPAHMKTESFSDQVRPEVSTSNESPS